MPRYVYECFECGHTVEKLEGWSAPAQQPCTECEYTLQRIPVAPAIVFKGSGWYSTDSRKSNWKSRRDEDRGEDGGSESEGRSESDGGSESEGRSESDGDSSSESDSGEREASTAAAD